MINPKTKILWVVLLVSLFIPQTALAQQPAYQTTFVTTFTFQNLGTATANATFTFYWNGEDEEISITRAISAGASFSIFVSPPLGATSEEFEGIYVESNQPFAIVQVQFANNSTTVRNRPLSNLVFFGDSQLYAATMLKNKFGATTRFAVQNLHSSAADITTKLYDLDNPSADPILLQRDNVAAHRLTFFDMGSIANVPSVFNGSAVVTAVEHGTTTPVAIAGSVLELETNNFGARAMDMASQSATRLFAATALCNAFGGQNTAYAIQNTDLNTPTLITIQYSNGSFETKQAGPGGKVSFNTCQASGVPNGFSGAAAISSSATPIIGIGKATGNGLFSAFGIETVGTSKLALPYIRYTSDTNFQCPDSPSGTQCRQRANIAIQNIGTAAVSNVQVKYLDKNGTVVGTHTISSIAAGGKANSKPVDAGNSITLVEFGTPDANPGGGFGGSALVEAPAGSQLIAIARVSSSVGTGLVAEDYNAQVVNDVISARPFK